MMPSRWISLGPGALKLERAFGRTRFGRNPSVGSCLGLQNKGSHPFLSSNSLSPHNTCHSISIIGLICQLHRTTSNHPFPATGTSDQYPLCQYRHLSNYSRRILLAPPSFFLGFSHSCSALSIIITSKRHVFLFFPSPWWEPAAPSNGLVRTQTFAGRTGTAASLYSGRRRKLKACGSGTGVRHPS